MRDRAPKFQYQRSYSRIGEELLFYSHVHTTYELLFVYRGEGRFVVEDNEYACRPNSLFLIPPGKYHVMHLAEGTEYERGIMNFEPALLPPIVDKRLLLHQVAEDRVRELFLRMEAYSEKYTGAALDALMQAVLTELLVSVVFDRGEDIARGEMPPLVKRAIAYIKEHIEEPLSATRIAEALFISETHLGHVFAQTMNTGLMHYVSIKKSYRARALLQGGATVNEVCDRLGYGSYTTFLRNYRACFGINPSQE